MKMSRFFLPVLLSVLLISAPMAFAQMRGGPMGGQGAQMGMMGSHGTVMQETLEIVKELAALVKDISHVPSGAQKSQLENIIRRLDKLIETHEQMMGTRPGMMR